MLHPTALTKPKARAQPSQDPIAVLGAGAWGTALALLASSKGIPVYLWARRAEHAQAMQEERQNREYLPGALFPEHLHPTADAEEALARAQFAVVAVPSRGLRETLQGLPKAPAYVSAVKGLLFAENHLLRISQVIQEATRVDRLAALSGPNLAEEVARFLPAAAVAASRDPALAQQVQQVFSGPSFRVYTTHDLVGVELGGALKNVIALAAGMVDGLGLGDNAKAALITRGLREIIRFGIAQGAQEATFMGLSGLGDLIATAHSPLSRNRSAGEQLVRGRTLDHLEAQKSVVEGIYTVKALHAWDQATGADLPITEAVYRVVYLGADPLEELSRLMGREAKPE
ncbi:MAG: NAD(P)H-dependent glycerol-3-phosphate dehydrogenase [Deinococcus-Thermus bacterium]|nr:MAG: NAD(P)H-dependent glycerol-3-phosphate dehydrogenase [Deinococcota bacterium]